MPFQYGVSVKVKHWNCLLVPTAPTHTEHLENQTLFVLAEHVLKWQGTGKLMFTVLENAILTKEKKKGGKILVDGRSSCSGAPQEQGRVL